MTDEQRIDIVEDQLEHMFYLCQSFAEVNEEDNCRALYEEYAEWFEVQNEEEGQYEVMWAPNFSLSN
jgi:hypothetical protein